jgi:hypothetical protein
MRNILIFCLLSLVCTLGCGKQGFNVSGKVTFPDGKPVSGGQVTLTSGRISFSGDLIGEGTYTINAQVPAGTYKVTVQSSGDPGKPQVDPKYSNPATSELVCEVKGPTMFDIKVEPQK